MIRIALEMSLEERRARHEALMAAVRKHDVTSWCQSFLAHLERVRAGEDVDRPYPAGPLRAALEKLGEKLDPRRARRQADAQGHAADAQRGRRCRLGVSMGGT